MDLVNDGALLTSDQSELLRHAAKHGIEMNIVLESNPINVTSFSSPTQVYLPGQSEVRMDLRGATPTMEKMMNVLLQILEEDEL